MAKITQCPPHNEAEGQNVLKQPAKKKPQSHQIGSFGRFLHRLLLVIFTVAILTAGGLALILNTVFNGPSESTRDEFTIALSKSSATEWIPRIFLGNEQTAQILAQSGTTLEEEFSHISKVVIQKDSDLTDFDQWADYPDGIRIETCQGATYNAYIMIIRDPSLVYMASSGDVTFSADIPGKCIHDAIADQSAIAAINAGAFYGEGSVPAGLLIVDGQVMSDTFHELVPEAGFAGFTSDNMLVVAKSMTAEQAEKLKIRDGCAFGPALIINGVINREAYHADSGCQPRSAIGQRADGSVIFLCIDGHQTGSLGASYRDMIDIMVEYGAVNACNLSGGATSGMMYLDTQGRYGTAGDYVMVNSHSLLQPEFPRMPSFWMVRPAEKED